MSDTTYVDYVAPAVNAEWLNEINDHVWHNTPVAGVSVHSAATIAVTPFDDIAATDVQAALNEINDKIPPSDPIDASEVSYTPEGTGAVTTTVQSKLRETVSVKDFGAVGDNITDDTSAITAALNYVLSFDRPPKLHIPPGLYKITGVLPTIIKPVTIEGDNPRSSIFMFSGGVAPFNIKGVGIRVADVKIRNLGINGVAMTAGYAVEIDFAQHIVFENVLLADTYNGVSIRQAGSIKFNDCLIDKVRGPYGVLAYGDSTSRNGETDQIDILAFHNTVIQSIYVPGGATSVTELLVLDGRVHTIQINGLRLLSAKRGLVTKNTPGLAINFCPRFITGDALEIESMLNECADFQYCVDFWIDGFFAAGSTSADGVLLGSNVSNWNVDKGSINSNWLSGITINGAKDVTITSLLVYNNALAGAGARSGIKITPGSGTVDIRGGLAGKASWLPAYTEKQAYGVDLDASYTGVITLDAVDVRGNNTGSIYTSGTAAAIGSSIRTCPGFNPIGVSLQAVGASPYNYTAGLTQEAINLYGGTGVVTTIGGVAVANASPCSFTLQPRQTATITYITLPTMAVSR